MVTEVEVTMEQTTVNKTKMTTQQSTSILDSETQAARSEYYHLLYPDSIYINKGATYTNTLKIVIWPKGE
eukprot:scaffold106017_cov80-Cyclotella_meneghiniana.AAC.4